MNKLIKRRALTLLTIVLSVSFQFAYAADIHTKIDYIYTYPDDVANYGGDIALKVTPSPSDCPMGFFIKKSTTSLWYKNVLTISLAAKHAKANLRLIGTPENWAGGGGVWCRLTTIGAAP